MNIVKIAFNGDSPPVTLNRIELGQFYMLRWVYQRYRAGKLSKSVGQELKSLIMNMEMLNNKDKQDLFDAFLLSWGKESMPEHKEEIKAISRLYLEVITDG